MALKKRIANLQDPTLEAVAEGLFRFGTLQQAVALLQRMSQQFVISKDQDPIQADTPPTLKLWIRGFGLTEEETAKGFRGHFARVCIQPAPNNKFTLIAEKLDVPLRLHPQKERPKFRHPNLGHPILRAAERGKPYQAIEDARAELLRLHEEFPETTIPGRDKLHMMVYSRKANPPIRKLTLRIQAATGLPEGETAFKLELAESIRKPAPLPPLTQDNEPNQAPVAGPAGGKFTSMVALQRRKKTLPKKKSASGE